MHFIVFIPVFCYIGIYLKNNKSVIMQLQLVPILNYSTIFITNVIYLLSSYW